MEDLGTIAAIWRYPVKSLKAEPLEQTLVDAAGLPGDRTSALYVRSGHAREGKPYRGKEHNLLHTTAQPDAAAAMARERGVTTELRAQPDTRYFDASPVSIVFDAWIAQVERALETPLDPLRWRPNFYVRAAADFRLSEADAVGAQIAIGDALFRVSDTIKRCVTTTYDVQTGEPDEDVLLYVAQKRANVMGVYCEVERAGTVRLGDALRLRALPTSRTTASSASM